MSIVNRCRFHGYRRTWQHLFPPRYSRPDENRHGASMISYDFSQRTRFFDSSSRETRWIVWTALGILQAWNVDELLRQCPFIHETTRTRDELKIKRKIRDETRMHTREGRARDVGTCLVKATTSCVLRPPWVERGRRRLTEPKLAESGRTKPKSTHEKRTF